MALNMQMTLLTGLELANAQTCLEQKGQEVLCSCVNKLFIPQTVINSASSVRMHFSLLILCIGISNSLKCPEILSQCAKCMCSIK